MLAAARAWPAGAALALISRSPIGRYLRLGSDWSTGAQLRYFLTSCALSAAAAVPARALLVPAPALENFVRRMLSLLGPRSRQTSAIAAADKISDLKYLDFEEKAVRGRSGR